MNYKKSLIILSIGLCHTWLVPQGAISLAPQEEVQPPTEILAPTGLAAPSTTQTSDLAILLDWFTWVQNNPAAVTENELKTLQQLIINTQTLTVDRETKNKIATAISNIFYGKKRHELSEAGKKIPSLLVQKKETGGYLVTFLSPLQLDFIRSNLPLYYRQVSIQENITQQPPLLGADPRTWSPTSQPQVQPDGADPRTWSPTPVQSKTASKAKKQKFVSYAKNIKAIMKLKKVSKILPNLIQLLDQTMGQQVDRTTVAEFTKALNSITKKSNKFNPTLQQYLATLLLKAHQSNFTAKNQKDYVQRLYKTMAKSTTSQPLAQPDGADPRTWSPTEQPLGADPRTWSPTAQPDGADPRTWSPTTQPLGADPRTWSPTAQPDGADPQTWSPTSQPQTTPTTTTKKQRKTATTKSKHAKTGSYAKNIKAIMKLKKASKILPNLTQLLDQTMGQQVDRATATEFTKALNNITKKSNKFGPQLRQLFATLLLKAHQSNFTAKNQKNYIQQLYNTMTKPAKQQQPTRRRR